MHDVIHGTKSNLITLGIKSVVRPIPASHCIAQWEAGLTEV